MQGVPMYPACMAAAGLAEPLLSLSGVSAAAARRMSGNTFNQACSGALIMYTLSRIRRCGKAANSSSKIS
jgi:hypothetical protein